MNWSKYSKPWDVIFDHKNYGFAQIMVRQLPAELPTVQVGGQEVKPHAYKPEHVPLCENYAHCEIWTFKDGVRAKNPAPSNVVKKEFRQTLADRLYVLHSPSI